MTKKEFLEEFQDILQKEEELLETDRLDAYAEWDSLSKLSTLALFDRCFNMQLTFDRINSLQTVADLINLAGGKVQ